jgi:hypothetical protein
LFSPAFGTSGSPFVPRQINLLSAFCPCCPTHLTDLKMVHQAPDSVRHCDASVTSVTAKVQAKVSHKALFLHACSGSRIRCRCVKRALTRCSRIPTLIDREARLVATQQIILGLPGPPRVSASPTPSKDMPNVLEHQPTGISI